MLTHGNYLEQCRALTSIFPFSPGVRYLSILPTNHAIDFMAGFIGPFVCGAAVVHLRSLRPEFVRDAFVRYRITYVTLVPCWCSRTSEKGLREKFAQLPPMKRRIFDALVAVNRVMTKGYPTVEFSRWLCPRYTKHLAASLRAIFVGGAFTEPSTPQFFWATWESLQPYGYGLTGSRYRHHAQ